MGGVESPGFRCVAAGRLDCNKTERPGSQVLKKCSDVTESDELSSVSHQKEITITIESIENIDYCHAKEILVKIEFLGEVLAQSEPIPVLRKNLDVGLTATINAVEVDNKFLDDILGNPVLFKVFECNTGAVGLQPPPPLPSSVKTEKEVKKKASKTSGTMTTTSKSEMTLNILGISNLELSELVMGKKRIREVLNIESDKKITMPESVHWWNFPRLVVVASTGAEKLIPDSANKYNNIIGITVESVYNLPAHIPTGALFDAIIPVPNSENKANSLMFPSGEVVNEKAVDNRKKWLSLLEADGPGWKSKHEISLTSSDVFNTMSPCYELEKGFNKIQHLIQWNMWKNSSMDKAASSYFFSKLMKYKVWPIEIIAASKASAEKTVKSDKKSKPAAPEVTDNSDRFLAFLNLSSFLYPGVTKVRVASQLYTYSQFDLINKFGVEFSAPASEPSVATLKSKASERSKAVAKEPESKSSSGSLVYNENGFPVFIIVEVELWKPFTPKKDAEYLEKQLKSYVCLKGKPKKKNLNLVLAIDNFSKTIKDVVSVLSKEYHKYIQLTKKDKNESESFVCFLNDFFYRREDFQKVKNSLENKITALIAEKYGELNQYKEMLPEIYIFLVEEMHRITNNFILGRSDVLTSHYNTDELQLYAEEALEEDEYELAREYLLLKLSRDESNPEYWLDYAVFSIKIRDNGTAIEAVREVLYLDISNRMGLLLYALLMTKISQGAIAEMVFQTLLTKYPDFIEGWMVLHLFYITVKSTEGEDVSFQMVMKLENEARSNQIKEDSQEKPEDEFSIKNYSSERWPTRSYKYGVSSYIDKNGWNQPLSWTTILCPAYSATVRTAVLMLQLGFYGHASMALAKSLVLNENSAHHPPHYFYYQAVCYYLQDFYDEALSQLEVPIRRYGKDCLIWALMGHCFYKLNDVANAIACYEYVLESYNRPDNIHLIYSRMGSFYLEAKKYLCAKKVFMTACKYSPTPRLWMGVGIACLRVSVSNCSQLGEYEEAETAFSEANYLDNKNPETWAYLALVNALLQRLELSKDCYTEARKRNLTNDNLKEELDSCLRQYHLEVEE